MDSNGIDSFFGDGTSSDDFDFRYSTCGSFVLLDSNIPRSPLPERPRRFIRYWLDISKPHLIMRFLYDFFDFRISNMARAASTLA
jgi:hypothetical protein